MAGTLVLRWVASPKYLSNVLKCLQELGLGLSTFLLKEEVPLWDLDSSIGEGLNELQPDLSKVSSKFVKLLTLQHKFRQLQELLRLLGLASPLLLE